MTEFNFWNLLNANRNLVTTSLFVVLNLVSAIVLNPKRIRTIKKGIYRQIIGPRVRRKKNAKVNIGAIFGMDVGGTLTKIVYFQQRRPDEISSDVPATPKTLAKKNSSENLAQLEEPDHQAALQELYSYMDLTANPNINKTVVRDDELSVYSPFLEGKLHFLHFETRNMLAAINLVSSSAFTEHVQSIGCTGGGAHKYSNEIFEKLEITVHKYDELGCLVRGMLFALSNFPDECYTFRNADDTELTAEGKLINREDGKTVKVTTPTGDKKENNNDNDSDPSEKIPDAIKRWQKDVKHYTKKVILPMTPKESFPFLIVNIGSGVSILKVSDSGKFERVSGTSLGGGTYWGLCRLLTKCQTYEEVLDLAENGDAGKVDMLVRDIYGGDYGGLLSGSMVASSFGKLVMKEEPREGVSEEDLALALLMMITNNIGQVAYLNAQLHQCSKIFFVGSFLRHNSISCRRLSFAIEFWSNSKMEALFLHHEGYFGALGTFLQSAYGDDVDKMLLQESLNQNDTRVPFQETSNNNSNRSASASKKTGRSFDTFDLKAKKRYSEPSVKVDDGIMYEEENDEQEAKLPALPKIKLPQLARGRSISDDVSHHALFNSASPARAKSQKQ